jgi:hypothetical protein
MSTSPAAAIRDAVQSVTKDWARQRKAEERNRSAIFNRRLRLVRSERVTLRDVAFEVMEASYLKASDDSRLPVKPRQVMYCSRPYILKKTGQRELNGSYFSQTLLVDYMEEYDCDHWDIIWDARGHFIEPHTNIEVPLGTLEVRQYLGERPSFGARVEANRDDVPIPVSFLTSGAEHRFGNILFIEKEGFHPILRAAQLQERFDIALMSTKGMSVTASRHLLDDLSPHVDRIFLLHDFDRAGFSIAGTIGSDSRRYSFSHDVTDKFVDIGLRLEDIGGLQSEPVPAVDAREWRQRAWTLRRHGASNEEIDFLRHNRVELNAMTSRQLVDFIEKKLAANGVKKILPKNSVIELQACRVIARQMTEQEMAKIRPKIAEQVRSAKLPPNLRRRVAALLAKNPALPWDLAVARVMQAR